MQPKLFAFFLSLLIITQTALCQDTTGYKHVSILLSPALIPLSPTQLAMQPGLQLRLHRWSLTAQIAFPLYKPADRYESMQYFRKSLELKRYFRRKRDWEEYLSAEVMYAKRNFTDSNGGTYFKGIYEDRFGYSRAKIHSPVFSGTIKAGAEFVVSKKIFIDAFLGLGVRTIYTRYSNVEGEARQPYGLLEISGPKSALRYDRTITKPHLACGFKVGLVLK